MKEKLIIIILAAFILMGLAGAVGAMGLAVIGPLDSGQGLFGVQNWAEHRFLALLPGPKSQAQYGLQLLERRIDDLAYAIGTPNEGKAYLYVSQEIIHAIDLFKKISIEDEPEFRFVFIKDLDSLSALKNESSSGLQPIVFSEFWSKVEALITNAEDDSIPLGSLSFNGELKEIPISSAAKESSKMLVLAEMESLIIPFPPGSAGAKHLFYPLDGKHSELTCLSCHSAGNYSGTPGQCTDCHLDVKPDGHFSGQCVLCHTTAAWLPSTFDHQVAIAMDCQSCHLSAMPAGHYQGQCSACHTTNAWLPAAFDHQTVGAALCQNCHAGNKPADHFNGPCSACHTTNAWLPASFDHQIAGAVDCASCHTASVPAGHYSGQCSACHATTAWLPAGFNHQAAGAIDCQACHSNVRPANHFSGQCSNCHSTSGWKPASFNHTFPTNHGEADGVCAKCHPSGDDNWTCFTCHNEYELTKKHNEEGIADYVVRCMDCHADGREHD